MNIPPKVSPGERPSAASYNALIDCLSQLQLRDSPPSRVSTTTTGTTLRAIPPPQVNATPGTAAPAEPAHYLHPKLTTMPPPDPVPPNYTPTPAWSVTMGVVNSSVIPSTATGTLGKDTNGNATSDISAWAVPIVAAGRIWLRAIRTGDPNSTTQGITAAEVIFRAGDEAPINTISIGHTMLGIITADPATPGAWRVQSYNSSNLNAAVCSGGNEYSAAWSWWNR